MPENILDIGITIVLFFQNLGDWLSSPTQFFTFLGSEEFYLFVAPAIYWCMDASIGLKVGLFVMLSASLNDALKVTFHGPRPYWYDLGVRALSFESSFGLPSGHAQNAVVVWGTFAAALNRGWVWTGSIIVIFLIGLSRLYLGVHFPSDVVVGWLTGALILWVILKLETPVMNWLNQNNPGKQIIIALTVSLILILVGLVSRSSLDDWTIPSSWVQNAAAPEAAPIDPLSRSRLVSSAGAFFGLAAGAIVLENRGGFNVRGVWWKRVVRFLVGLAGVILIWSGLGAILPRGEYLSALSLRYLRYILIGFWVTGLAPALFIHSKLAESKRNLGVI